ILAHKDEIKGKLGENLREHEHLAKMSKDLVTIDTNGVFDITIHDLKKENVKTMELMSFFQSLDLHVFVKKMEVPTEKKEDWNYKVIKNDEELNKVLTTDLALHFEFSDYNYHKAELWGIGLASKKDYYYLSSEF